MPPKPESLIRPGVTAGDGVVELTVHSAAYGMRVTCTIGLHPSFTRLVIRYRTDGAIPLTPEDGLPLLDTPAIAGTTYRGCHNPLHRGLDYSYTAFGLDDRGSIRASATTSGRPSPG